MKDPHNNIMKYKYLFGPVPSRRLGISLGVDLVPYKVCTFGCVYCECGRTTDFSEERKPYVKADNVIEELKNFLKDMPQLDYITFSGGGEPTLNSEIEKIISFIKKEYPSYKTALLTNGSLLSKKEVRDSVKKCDLIIPSIDAVSQEVFEKINRPGSAIKIKDIIKGIKKLKTESSAIVWVEVFIVPGINDNDKELKLLRDTIISINPAKIQLNTLDRPGTEKGIHPASGDSLAKIKEFFGTVKIEIVKNTGLKDGLRDYLDNFNEKVFSLLKRRPCTITDLSQAFDIRQNKLIEYLHELEKSGRIISQKEDRGVFYKIEENNGTKKNKQQGGKQCSEK